MRHLFFFICIFLSSYQSFCRSFEKFGYKIDQKYRIDECYLSIFAQVFDEQKRLHAEEEGVISLKNHITWNFENYRYAFLLKAKEQDKNLPSLFFVDEQSRLEFLSQIKELQYSCKNKNIHSQEEELLQNPPVNKFIKPIHKKDLYASLLTNGKEAWIGRSFINDEAFKKGHSISIQTLIFMADEAGLHWSDDLIMRKRHGVNVRVFIDALSPFLDVRDLTVRQNTKRMYHNMMAAGIPVYGYRCGFSHHLFDEASLSAQYRRSILNQRYHEKIWIVNKDYAILGGMNIGNDYFRLNKKGKDYWRDQDLLIKNKNVVSDVQSIFDANVLTYTKNYQDPKNDFCFNPYEPNSIKYEQFFMSHKKNYKTKRIRKEKKEKQSFARNQIKKFETEKKIKPLLFESIKQAQVIHNRPKLQELHIENEYLNIINKSKKEIIISNAYFIPSLQIQKFLKRAAKRGVQIYIMTNDYRTNDIPPISILSRNGYLDLVVKDYSRFEENKRHIKIYEWSGQKNFDLHQSQGTNHAKYIVSDRNNIFIGSYNLDPRSRDINSEIGFSIKSRRIGKTLAKNFFKTDLKYAKLIEYKDMIKWKKHISVLKESWLQMKGGYADHHLLEIGKKRFFEHIAHQNPMTW